MLTASRPAGAAQLASEGVVMRVTCESPLPSRGDRDLIQSTARVSGGENGS